MGNPSQTYGVSPATWDHAVLPATGHRWKCPGITRPGSPVLNLPSPEGWKAELTWPDTDSYIHRWHTCAKTVTHPSTNRAQCTATTVTGVVARVSSGGGQFPQILGRRKNFFLSENFCAETQNFGLKTHTMETFRGKIKINSEHG